MNFIEILDSYVENRFGAVLRCVAAGGPLFWPTGPDGRHSPSGVV
jgi:hypothetical protein